MNQKFDYLDIRLLNFVFFCNIILFMVIDSVGNEVYNKFGIVFKLGACSVLLQY